jgi:malonate transporter
MKLDRLDRSEHGHGGRKRGKRHRHALRAAVSSPLVWAPLLGIVLAVLGISLPPLATNSLELLGASASGVAIFAVGLALAAHRLVMTPTALTACGIKMLVQPIVLASASSALGRTCQRRRSSLRRLPSRRPAFCSLLPYKTFEVEASSILALTIVATVFVLPASLTLLQLVNG